MDKYDTRYKAYKGDVVVINQEAYGACFGTITYNWSTYKDAIDRIVVELIPNSNSKEVITRYIEMLNKFIPGITQLDDTHVEFKMPPNKAYFIAGSASIRYIFEGKHTNTSSNDYDLIPKTTVDLYEKYDIDECQAFGLAHFSCNNYSSGHGVLHDLFQTLFTNEEFIDIISNNTSGYGLTATIDVWKGHKTKERIYYHEKTVEQMIEKLGVKVRSTPLNHCKALICIEKVEEVVAKAIGEKRENIIKEVKVKKLKQVKRIKP